MLLLALCVGLDMLSRTVVRAADVSHELGTIKPTQLSEISGVAASRLNPEVLWVHNDGDSRQVFAVSTSGKLAAFLKVKAAISDMEDIAIGPGPEKGVDYLYLGDIGDNDERRREVRIVRFPEPDLNGERGLQLNVDDAEEIRLTYPDGPHDAEALFVDPVSGDLFIVTKEDGRARLYTVGGAELRDGSSAKLTAVGKPDAVEVSAGAISADGSQILLRREGQGWLWNRAAGESVVAALERKPTKVPVLGKRQGPNGEAVSFGPAGDSYFTVSEGKKQAIYRFDLPSAGEDAGR
jgi:hypothetical protein